MNRYSTYFLLLISTVLLLAFQQMSAVYVVKESTINFKSDAPLELIEASSKEMKGLIDFEKETFAFSVAVNTFEGFNSALQKEHFNENFMETKKYPKATFSGKMIESADVSKDGEYTIRTKGKLVIHGVEQERIIKSTVTVKDGLVHINSNFTVPLKDHNISIPKVVHQKIAEEIHVEIKALAEKK